MRFSAANPPAVCADSGDVPHDECPVSRESVSFDTAPQVSRAAPRFCFCAAAVLYGVLPLRRAAPKVCRAYGIAPHCRRAVPNSVRRTAISSVSRAEFNIACTAEMQPYRICAAYTAQTHYIANVSDTKDRNSLVRHTGEYTYSLPPRAAERRLQC